MIRLKQRNKPLGLPIKTPFGLYYYETQKNEIIKIYQEMYDYLYAIIFNNDLDYKISPKCQRDMDELFEAGYLKTSNILKIEHPQTLNIENLLNRKLTMITLQLTQQCNLRCRYCIYSESSNYNRAHSSNRMSFETAKQAIDFYHSHSIDSDKIVVAFYGGEPTLEFDLIQDIVEYVNSRFEGKSILYRITTNATLINDEMIEFFFNSGNEFYVLISLDGPQKIHDSERRFVNGEGSYEIVIKNLKKIYEKNPAYMEKLHINTVVDPRKDYNNIFDFSEEPWLKDIAFQFNLVERDGESEKYTPEYLEKFNYDMFLGYMVYFREVNKIFPNKLIEYNFSYIKDSIEKFYPISLGTVAAPGGPCEAGRMRLFVNCKGDFFPCERVSESSNCMNIGSLKLGFDIEKIKKMMNIGQITEEDCKNCWAFYLCNICVKKADDNGIISASKKMKACSFSKRVAIDKINHKILEYENDYVYKEQGRRCI